VNEITSYIIHPKPSAHEELYAMALETETLKSLAESITRLTNVLTTYLESHELASPSFSTDGLAEYPIAPEFAGPRMMLIQSLFTMLHLAMGSKDYIFTQGLLV
jgi:hypothetical protein